MVAGPGGERKQNPFLRSSWKWPVLRGSSTQHYTLHYTQHYRTAGRGNILERWGHQQRGKQVASSFVLDCYLFPAWHGLEDWPISSSVSTSSVPNLGSVQAEPELCFSGNPQSYKDRVNRAVKIAQQHLHPADLLRRPLISCLHRQACHQDTEGLTSWKITCQSMSTPWWSTQMLKRCQPLTSMVNGACYELELIKAAGVQSIQKACSVDQLFSKYVTRINKVCRGTANCSPVPMDKDLFVDPEDFARAFRKEVPPGVCTSLSRICLGPQWCKTDTAKADLRCFAQEFLYAPFRMAFQRTRMASNFTRSKPKQSKATLLLHLRRQVDCLQQLPR